MTGSGERKDFLGLAEEVRICARCGSCRASCPAYREVGWESASPRARVALAAELLRDPKSFTPEAVQRLLQCTLCGNCRESCAAEIDTRQFLLGAREALSEKGLEPEAYRRLASIVSKSGNVGGFENDTRADWTEDLETPVALDAPEAETGYFVGCVASFYPMVSGIPESFARLAALMNRKIAVLGADEVCCGFPLLIAGKAREAEALIRRNAANVEERALKTLVTGCPSCFHTWTHVYPKVLGREPAPEVVHFTQFLERAIREGALDVSGLEDLDEVVTYHDPCDLGRNAGIYEAPRNVIRSLPGMTLVEMAHNRKEALCCGGGGNLQSVDPDLTKSIADARIREALDTGATVLVTACQQCVQVLTESARRNKARLRVLDIVQLVAQAL